MKRKQAIAAITVAAILVTSVGSHAVWHKTMETALSGKTEESATQVFETASIDTETLENTNFVSEATLADVSAEGASEVTEAATLAADTAPGIMIADSAIQYETVMKTGASSQGTYLSDESAVDDLLSEIVDSVLSPEGISPDVAAKDDVSYAANQLLIKFNKTFGGQVTQDLADAGIGKLEPLFELPDYTWYTGYLLKSADVEETLASVLALPNVISAEYNYESTMAAVGDYQTALSNNPLAGQQLLIQESGVTDAWAYMENMDIPAGGKSSVITAVIDTGVDYTHTDLKANMWVNSGEIPDNDRDDDGNGYIDDYYGVDMAAGHGSAMDDNGHGTHVAGIIAASNNKEGIVGAAYNTTVMPIKAGDASGHFLNSHVAEGIIYAYENGAAVINMSFGGEEYSQAIADALEIAYQRCVLVAAAGNDKRPNASIPASFTQAAPVYPAALPYVIGVMSCDWYLSESSFSNWDVTAYDDVEYEVYAPGESILSTIPGNEYATWSGTSMAAPFVAAEAALLRSVYVDRDRYNTKYIVSQIVGNADYPVTCIDTTLHPHSNLGCVDILSAMTKAPTPKIVLKDRTIFDTVSFAGDVDGLTSGCEDVNNGDGYPDAGETLALGLTLRNITGAASNVTVHIEAESDLGVKLGKVAVLNNDISYGMIGTNATTDCGKIYTGSSFTGWEKPFYIRIDKDCPNDYGINLHVTMTYRNGLDDRDETVYSAEDNIVINVRQGIPLPKTITEDMTLTKDHLYIVDHRTTINEGVTLTIEPGTRVQFWAPAAEGAYPTSGIDVGLVVKGRLNALGTQEEPVELFPCERLSDYIVSIKREDKGETRLSHTIITNPAVSLTKADNCEFRQTATKTCYLSLTKDSSVYTAYAKGDINIDDAQGCAFYKLSMFANKETRYGIRLPVRGNYTQCIFVDSYIRYENGEYDRCVFYGNNDIGPGVKNEGSEFNAGRTKNNLNIDKTVYDPKSGKLYVAVISEYMWPGWDGVEPVAYEKFFEKMGGSYALINDESVYRLLKDNLTENYYFYCGFTEDQFSVYNRDGSPIKGVTRIDVYQEGRGGGANRPYINFTYDEVRRYWISNDTELLFEVPLNVYVADITLSDYVVTLDEEESYQIEASVKPAACGIDQLIYESEDENVARVSAAGLVTPTGKGSTRVRVYSPDLAIYNYVTVNVTQRVVPETVTIADSEMTLAVGDTKKLTVSVSPVNATKHSLRFESTDDNVLAVDDAGLMTALDDGDVTVTVYAYGDVSASIGVHCRRLTKAIAFADDVYETSLSKDDGHDFYPQFEPVDAENTTLVWETAEPEVAYVDEAGNLVKLKEGMTQLKATVAGTDISATVMLNIGEESASEIVQVASVANTTNGLNDRYYFALTKSGTIYVWGNTITIPTESDFSAYGKICQMYVVKEPSEYAFYLINENDDLYLVKKQQAAGTVYMDAFLMHHAAKIGQEYNGSICFIDTSGNVWGLGSNSDGQLGDGTLTAAKKPVLMNCRFTAEMVYAFWNNVYVITTDGDVYKFGNKNSEPEYFGTNAAALQYNGQTNKIEIISRDDVASESAVYNNGINAYFIKDGRVYIKGSNTYGQLGTDLSADKSYDYVMMDGITNAVSVYPVDESLMILTEDNKLYVVGKGDKNLGGKGTTNNITLPTKVSFNSTINMNKPTVKAWNFEETDSVNTLTTNTITLTYDMAIKSSSLVPTITDSHGTRQWFERIYDLNKLILNFKEGLTPGETYTLTLPSGIVTSLAMTKCDAQKISFVYTGEATSDSEDDREIEEDEDAVLDQEVIVVGEHESVDRKDILKLWNEYRLDGYADPRLHSCVILNRTDLDGDPELWLRFNQEAIYNLADQYWGGTDRDLIMREILTTYRNQIDDELTTSILTEAPDDTYPFVVDAYLEVDDERTDLVGNQNVKFVVVFNRAMDESIPLDVRFGSQYPYADYSVNGQYVSPTEWQGYANINTMIESGLQYWSVSNGCAKDTEFKLYKDWGRFPFKIDGGEAMSMTLNGRADENGISLSWVQDDFSTLAGYNIYRATEEDGNYVKINRTIIPSSTTTWIDEDVMPGQTYYYNFTVVKTDMEESEPSGRVSVTAADVMAPVIYHSPMYFAYTGSSKILTAQVSDNIRVDSVKLYFRVKGEEEWYERDMTQSGSIFSGMIEPAFITTAGLEYYIEAFDGANYARKGSADMPYDMTIQEAIGREAKGDVDGNGLIEPKDALMSLQAFNGKRNLTAPEFTRADLNDDGVLSLEEAMRIIQFVNGTVTTMTES